MLTNTSATNRSSLLAPRSGDNGLLKFALLVALSSTAALPAQSVVVPSAAQGVATGGGYTTLLRSAPRTYVVAIEASELAGIPVGDAIVGMSFRAGTNMAQPYPNQAGGSLDYTDFTITIGSCVAPSSITYGGSPAPLISSIWLGSPVVARTGPLSIPNGTFVHNGVSPSPYTEYYFEFQTPVVYTGGDFAILVERSANNNNATGTFEGAPNGYRAGNYAFGNSVAQGPELAYVNTPLITRLHHGYGLGCPGSSGTPPVLVQSGNTQGGLGGTINLEIGNAPAGTLVAFGLGFALLPAPLPNGCSLLVSPFGTVLMTADTHGRAAFPLNIPAVVQAAFEVQGAVIDPGAAGGYTTTNGVSPRAN